MDNNNKDYSFYHDDNNNDYNSNNNNGFNDSVSYDLPHEQFFLVLNHMTVFVLPIEIFVGCVGNSLAFYVLVSSHLIRQSCNVYLAFLTIVDTGFLLCTLFVWLDFLGLHSVSGFCQGIPYMTYVFSFLSGYTVVSFTVERFIVTFYPLQRQHMCTTRRAKIVVCSLTVFALIFYSFPLYMSTLVRYEGYQECRPLEKFIKAATILSSIDSIMTLMLPSVVIIVLNIAISVKITKIYSLKSRRRLGHYGATVEIREPSTQGIPMTQQCSIRSETSPVPQRYEKLDEAFQLKKKDSTSLTIEPTQPSRYTRSLSNASNASLLGRKKGSVVSLGTSTRTSTGTSTQVKTTRTLILLSSLFVLLKLPSHALRLHTFIHSFLATQTHSDTMWLLAWQELCQFVYYLNFASNFFLYCLFSKAIRSVAYQQCCRRINCC